MDIYIYISHNTYIMYIYIYIHSLCPPSPYTPLYPPPPPKTKKSSQKVFSPNVSAGKAFTLTANNTLLAGLEGPLVKDDPSVRRLMEAGWNSTGTGGVEGCETYSHTNMMACISMHTFFLNKSKGKDPEF